MSIGIASQPPGQAALDARAAFYTRSRVPPDLHKEGRTRSRVPPDLHKEGRTRRRCRPTCTTPRIRGRNGRFDASAAISRPDPWSCAERTHREAPGTVACATLAARRLFCYKERAIR
jgi:hypothetical protein